MTRSLCYLLMCAFSIYFIFTKQVNYFSDPATIEIIIYNIVKSLIIAAIIHFRIASKSSSSHEIYFRVFISLITK